MEVSTAKPVSSVTKVINSFPEERKPEKRKIISHSQVFSTLVLFFSVNFLFTHWNQEKTAKNLEIQELKLKY